MAQATGSRACFKLCRSSSVLCRPAHRSKVVGLLPTRPRAHRTYNSSSQLKDYPKEGVFQPNSPRRHPLVQNALQQDPYAGPDQRPQYDPQDNQPPQEPPQPTRRSPLNFSFFVSVLLFAVFAKSGFEVVQDIGREWLPTPLNPGSPEDHERLNELAAQFDSLPLVRQLRSEYELDDGEGGSGGQKRAWREWVAYRGVPKERSSSMLTKGALRGSRGLAAQSVFWNETLGACMVFVCFGEGVCGFPGVVHGGAIATVMDETLGRVAIQDSESGSAVTANLSVEYWDKCVPGQWYVLLAQLERPDEEDLAHAAKGNGDVAVPKGHSALVMQPARASTTNKKFVEGLLCCVNEQGPLKEDVFGESVDEVTGEGIAHIHAVAKGLFVVPKGLDLAKIKDQEY